VAIGTGVNNDNKSKLHYKIKRSKIREMFPDVQFGIFLHLLSKSP